MRTTQLLATAATVVLIGSGIATAQDVKRGRASDAGPGGATTYAGGEDRSANHPGRTQGPGDHRASRAQGGARAVPHAADNATRSGLNSKDDLKGKQHSDTNNDANASATNANQEKSGENVAASSKAETRSTTGQGSAAGAAKLTAEQRTKITTIFQKHKVAPVRLNVVGHRRNSDFVEHAPLPHSG